MSWLSRMALVYACCSRIIIQSAPFCSQHALLWMVNCMAILLTDGSVIALTEKASLWCCPIGFSIKPELISIHSAVLPIIEYDGIGTNGCEGKLHLSLLYAIIFLHNFLLLYPDFHTLLAGDLYCSRNMDWLSIATEK